LVAAYVTLHRDPEARKVLADALGRNGKDSEALLQRTAIYLRSGDLASAERDLDQVISMQPDSAPAHFELAAVKRMRGLPKSEREELTESLVHDPNYLPARLALARNYLSANEAKSTLELLDTAPPAQQNTREVSIERNWALLGVNDRKAARAGIDKVLRVSRSPDVLEQDGLFRMMERDFGGARMDAEEILAQDSGNQRGIRLLVDSYRADKQLPAAVEKLRAIAADHPKSAPVQAAIGQVLLNLGNRPEARKAFEAAASAEPAFSPAQLALAKIDFEENRLDSARRRVAAALASEPTNVMALSAAGDIELRAGSNAAALEKYRSVLGVDGSNVPALISTAGLLVLDSQLDEALKFAQQAVELAPDNPRAQEALAWVYYRKGIYRSAIDCLKKAVSKNPTPLRQYHLALSYIKSGEISLGQQTLLAAMQQDPNLPRKDQGW
jgi:tetratricopeptide (TPR) repeat protein